MDREFRHIRGQRRQHIFTQIGLEQVTRVADRRELGRKLWMSPHSDRREVQGDGPTFRAPQQRLELIGLQLDAHPAQQDCRLGGREGKVPRSQLDEPFAGVDPLSVLDIQRIIRELTVRGIGVLITDHNVRETLGVCARAYIVNQGTVIAAGTAEEVLANPQVREVYLGESFRL